MPTVRGRCLVFLRIVWLLKSGECPDRVYDRVDLVDLRSVSSLELILSTLFFHNPSWWFCLVTF